MEQATLNSLKHWSFQINAKIIENSVKCQDSYVRFFTASDLTSSNYTLFGY